MHKIIVLLLLLSNISWSQINFVAGYLLNDKGDTLKGEIKVNQKKELDLYNKVFFKDASGAQKNYKANKVKGYGFNGRNFVATVLDDEPKFFEQLTKGDIILYKIGFDASTAKESIVDHDYFLFREGDKKPTDVKIGKVKKQLQEWMSGAASFASDYQDEKKFNETLAVEVITKYNEWKKNN